jgi:hypothetical protein
MVVARIIEHLRTTKWVTDLVPTLDSVLQSELKDCTSILDLGCGPKSPVRNIDWTTKKVGVEAFEPYAKTAEDNCTHDEIVRSLIQDLDIEENSYDAVILIDVIEHMPKDMGLQIIQLSKKWARKKVIISSPNGFIKQESLDGNELQQHLSGWPLTEMTKLDFRVRGMAGLKFLRREVQEETMGDDLLVTIRFRPRFFWFLVSTFSQPFVYRKPKYAFSLLSVSDLHEKNQ